MMVGAAYNGDTSGMLGVFAALHRQGAIGIASLPEYWRNYWDDLDRFVAAGVDGFEIVNCAPKALGFPAPARARVLELARDHDLLVVGASDNHGWGRATCVWNVSSPSGAPGGGGGGAALRLPRPGGGAARAASRGAPGVWAGFGRPGAGGGGGGGGGGGWGGAGGGAGRGGGGGGGAIAGVAAHCWN